MTIDRLVERVARAIAREATGLKDPTPEQTKYYSSYARAALSASPVQELVEDSATVTAWVDQAFGVSENAFRRASRCNEEVAELLTAVASDAPGEKIGEEAADVAIILHLICGRLGLDLNEQIALKMQKNRSRKWAVDATGCGYHIKKPLCTLQTQQPCREEDCDGCLAGQAMGKTATLARVRDQ